MIENDLNDIIKLSKKLANILYQIEDIQDELEYANYENKSLLNELKRLQVIHTSTLDKFNKTKQEFLLKYGGRV